FVPCKSKAAFVPAGSRNSSAFVTAGGSDPAASRNKPAVNSAGRPKPIERVGHPAGWDDGGDPSTDNDIGIVDSGCSRSMTGNKEKLDDFVQVKGGIIKFGGGDGRILGKGTIRTSKLDFENVYYVEELQHFNLFYVSQICDKKNKVLFTDTDCLVLSEEFQLPDESQVVLRIPRERDLYTFSISELQPEQNVTCLVAKASLDESTRWHRRMAHVNFKTINKLAKEGLVDGLPLKVFTNEHNCVACNKGISSRPDIMFAVSACSRHQVTPLTSHLNAVKKIFKYLKGQPKLGLWYPKDSTFQLEAYNDSDYAGSHRDRKSTTGGCQFLGR
ncbi:ribonuclease H-like domain-containing protein, partial [Tanacetum coccineum]